MRNPFAGRAVTAALAAVVVATFGHVSWQPPGWLRTAAAFLLAHRRKTAGALILVLLAAFGGRYAYTHRKPRPRPHFTTVGIVAPAVPPLADEIVPGNLVVTFDGSVAPLARKDADLPANLVRLDPPLPGAWRWSDDRRLNFTPKGAWPAAQTFHVTIDPVALAPHVLLESYRLETRTPGFSARFERPEFYQNPQDLAVRQVTATILTSHAVDPADLERRLSVAMLGNSPVFGANPPAKLFTLLPGRHGREFFLRSVPLALPAELDTMKITLAPGLGALRGNEPLAHEEIAKVKVPDLYSFFQIKETTTRIVKNKDGNPEQFLIVETSCEARSEDLAKSLELYALPPDNPARHEKDAAKSQASSGADSNGDSDSDDEEDASSETAAASEPARETDDHVRADDDDHLDGPGDHDGRYHDDSDETYDKSGTESADRADASHPSDGWAAAEVDAPALARARRLTPTLVPSARETSTVHTFRLRDDAPGFLFVKVAKHTPAPGGYLLREDYGNVLSVPVPDKEIVIQGDGGILALSGERKLSVQSRGIPAIRYEIARVPAAEINHLASQTEGNFQSPTFSAQSYFNEQDIAKFTAQTQPIALRNPVDANYSTFDFTGYLRPVAADGLDREGLFFLTASGWDPKTKKYLRNVKATRFVLVTDLGLLAKRNADGSRDVFVGSLATGTPLGAVHVAVLARNGAVLADAVTDDAGRASLPSLGKNPVDSREPVAIVARRGGDVSFLPYERKDRVLDFSRFAVEGVENRTGRELDAFVFTERGVYRPGDTLHVGVIVKQRDWNGSLDGLPLETEVIDARDQSAQVKPLVLPAAGFGEWTFDTAPDSPTGGYTLNVYLQRAGKRSTLLGSATVQVKEFLPDRLKLDVSLAKSGDPAVLGRGWVTPDDLRGNAVLKNLFGTAAENHLVKAHLRLNPRGFTFKEYPGYTFYDRLRESKKDWEGDTVELGDQHTAVDGTADFDFDLKRFADATYRLTFDAEGFEAEGGRSVEDLASTLVSPLPSVVGWHADGDLNWITANGPARTVDFVGVDRALNRIPLENLTVHLAEQQWISVLTKGENGSYRYESVRRERPISDTPFVPQGPEASPRPSLPPPIPEVVLPLTTFFSPLCAFAALREPPFSASAFILPSATPGNYLLELRDKANLPVSRLEYTVVGQGQTTRSLEKNAELEIHLSREQYRAGEDIEISLTSPYAGSGLITLERERVYTHKWFKSTGTASVQTITIPPDFDGTGYVNVSFVRALDSREIFTSPLSYAVAPFTVNLEHRRLHVDLRAVEKTRPGEPLAIHYRTDRPAKLAVFAVDQGILQVTKFQTPDPLAHHFRKNALTVRTSQIVDLLLPEFSILRAAQSVGGDGDPGVLNPFRRVTEKPVVYWSGIVDADATDRTLTYSVPDYFNGTLTIMAVAVSPDALGSVKTSTLCRNAFVLTPAVPTLAAPGDEFEVGLSVANGQVGSGPDAKITVQAEPGPGLQIVRGPANPLQIPEGREASTTFRVRALEKLGSAQLGFRASNHGEDSRVHSTLSIRPAMSFRTVVTSGHFPGGVRDVPVSGGLYAEYRRLETSFSALPIGLARGLDRYLKEYPHGCSEQITSGAFARLALADVADFGLTRAEAAAQIEHVMAIQRRRQNDAGGFGFWDASKTPDIDFITVYVMHFLGEAKSAGYPVPDDVFQKGLGALRRCASASPWSLHDARIQAYAIYVLTREGIVTTNNLLTLRDYLNTYYKPAWPGDLTAVYLAGSWALLKKDDEARRLIDGYHLGRTENRHEWWDFYQPLGADSQYVTILARHFPDKLRGLTPEDFAHVTEPIVYGRFSTLTAAYAVQALRAYSETLASHPPRLTVAALLPPKAREQPLSLAGSALTLLHGEFPPAATALRFRADGTPPLGVYYQAVQSGFDHALPTAPVAHDLEVYRDLLDADGKKPVTTLKLGDRLTVRLRLRSTTPYAVTNVAVLDLLPGGFEIADDSLKPGTNVNGMDYVDVREDRAIFYGTATGAVREITYRIKPTARGEFTVPPIFAESMYDKTVQSLGLGSHLTVTADK